MNRGLTFIPMPKWAQRVNGEPRAPLGTWPSPVEKMDRTSDALGVEVWVKREDLAGAWGGNKVRKLEFWLASPKVWKRRSLIVSGAGSSTWTAATAFHGHRLGLEVTAALAGEIPNDRRRLYEGLGTRVMHAGNLNALPLVVARARAKMPRAVGLPMGGSGWPGDLGSYLCGTEIVDGYLRRTYPRPERIFVAAGTAGTAAGIATALAHRGAATPVVAVRVTPRPLGTEALINRRAKKLIRRIDDVRGGDLSIVGENGFFGDGYGEAGPGVDEALELAAGDGIDLERTYTGKAFAALVTYARTRGPGPLLFIHTAAGPTPRVGR